MFWELVGVDWDALGAGLRWTGMLWGIAGDRLWCSTTSLGSTGVLWGLVVCRLGCSGGLLGVDWCDLGTRWGSTGMLWGFAGMLWGARWGSTEVLPNGPAATDVSAS